VGARRTGASWLLATACVIDPRGLPHQPPVFPPAQARGEVQVRRRRKQGQRADLAPAAIRSERAVVAGLHFHILVVVDDFTRESLALIPTCHIAGNGARELDALLTRGGRPTPQCAVASPTKVGSRRICRLVRLDFPVVLTVPPRGRTEAGGDCVRLNRQQHRQNFGVCTDWHRYL
jgi:hypothetical protein